LGIDSKIGDDYIEIYGGNPKSNNQEIETYHDHRIAMSLAIAGSKIEGIIIQNSEVVKKSFPAFWEVLEKIGVGINEI
jgi:3-phosphoshikimate 1-carboxyvinyltransferase